MVDFLRPGTKTFHAISPQYGLGRVPHFKYVFQLVHNRVRNKNGTNSTDYLYATNMENCFNGRKGKKTGKRGIFLMK